MLPPRACIPPKLECEVGSPSGHFRENSTPLSFRTGSEHPEWSRKRIAKELCQRWGWADVRERLKFFRARGLLLKLEGLGRICLPPLQVHQRRKRRAATTWADRVEPAAWTARLEEIEPVRLEPVEAGSPAAQRWGFYLERYPYLGLRVVGENLGYLATDRQGRDVGCLLFGAAAWKCAPPGPTAGLKSGSVFNDNYSSPAWEE